MLNSYQKAIKSSHQLIDSLNNLEKENEISDNKDQDTAINNFNEKRPKKRQRKPNITKVKVKIKDLIKKNPKKLKAKKPAIKKQKTSKKPYLKKSYRNKEKLNTGLQQLFSIGEENNTLTNSPCQKTSFYHEDEKKIDKESNDSKLEIGSISKVAGENAFMDFNIKFKVSFLENGGFELDKKNMKSENKNENKEKNLQKNCISESWLPQNASWKEILSNPKELEETNSKTEKKCFDTNIKKENLISNHGLEAIEGNNVNEANMQPLNAEESKSNDLENENEEYSNDDHVPDEHSIELEESDEHSNKLDESDEHSDKLEESDEHSNKLDESDEHSDELDESDEHSNELDEQDIYFNHLDDPDDADNLIPPCDEDINLDLINSLNRNN